MHDFVFDYIVDTLSLILCVFLDNMCRYPTVNRPGALAGGLNYIADTLLNTSKGWRGGRTVVVVVADGVASEGTTSLRTAATHLHTVASGADVASVAVGTATGLASQNTWISTSADFSFMYVFSRCIHQFCS